MALMLVPSGRVPVTGPRTKEGMIVASSKPSFLLSSQAFFSATVCNEQVKQSALTYLLNSAITTTFATIETSVITNCWLKPKHVQFVAPSLSASQLAYSRTPCTTASHDNTNCNADA